MEKAWYFIEINNRPHPKGPSTYSKFSYEELPPIKMKLDDNFKWLRRQSSEHRIRTEGKERWPERMLELEAQMNMKFPPTFTKFFKTTELLYRLSSGTDCFFILGERAVKTVGKYEGFIVLFLSDQQGCLRWYLYLDNSGNHFILVSRKAYGFHKEESLVDKDGIDLEEEDFYFCAPSFKEFIYRFWIENSDCRTAVQKQYVNHYLSIKR